MTRKISEEHKEKIKHFNKPVEDLINELSDEELLNIGVVVCSSDFAVAHYNHRWHPKFYHKKEELAHAVRRAWVIGAFNHRERIVDMIEEAQ